MPHERKSERKTNNDGTEVEEKIKHEDIRRTTKHESKVN